MRAVVGALYRYIAPYILLAASYKFAFLSNYNRYDQLLLLSCSYLLSRCYNIHSVHQYLCFISIRAIACICLSLCSMTSSCAGPVLYTYLVLCLMCISSFSLLCSPALMPSPLFIVLTRVSYLSSRFAEIFSRALSGCVHKIANYDRFLTICSRRCLYTQHPSFYSVLISPVFALLVFILSALLSNLTFCVRITLDRP